MTALAVAVATFTAAVVATPLALAGLVSLARYGTRAERTLRYVERGRIATRLHLDRERRLGVWRAY